MNPDDRPEITHGNDRTYNRLVASLEMGLGQLQILLASCDHDRDRQNWIARYEAELVGQARLLRARLDGTDPSLSQAIARSLEQAGDDGGLPTVVTVVGAEGLGLTGPEPIEKFLGYLQWTREALRDFNLPIVLWLPSRLLPELPRQAPDFWSWRDGVFLFTAATEDGAALDSGQQIQMEPLASTAAETVGLSVADLEASLAEAETKLGPNSREVADLLRQLGDRYADRYRAGRGPENASLAEEKLRRAIALYEVQEQPETLAASLSKLAYLYKSQGQYEAAEPLYRRALAIRERVLGPDHPDTAQSLNNLAGLYYFQGQYEAAEPLFRRALDIRERVLGPDHPDTAQSLNNLANLYQSQGQYEAAEPLYRRALEIKEQVLGPDHPDTAQSLNNLANLYQSQGQYEAAEPLYRRSLAIHEQVLGPDHPDTAASLNGLAALYDSQGQYEAAEPLYRRALAIHEQVLGPDHPHTAASLNNLAYLYYSQGQYEAAEPLFRRALAICEQVLGPDHPNTATSLNNLAGLYDSQGQYEAAEPLYRRCMEIALTKLGQDHPLTRTFLRNFRRFVQTVIAAGRAADLSDHPLTQSLLQELTRPPEP
jgi:tetratricopeptide (TPR) repeat protein